MKKSEFYKEYLDVKFNSEYYANRLSKAKFWNKAIDIFLALFAGSSGIAAFGIWGINFGTVEAGKILFSILAGIGLVLGITRPILKLDDEIERLSGIQNGYSTLGHQLEDLLRLVDVENTEASAAIGKFETLRSIRSALDAKGDAKPHAKLAERCQKIIQARHEDKAQKLRNHLANNN